MLNQKFPKIDILETQVVKMETEVWEHYIKQKRVEIEKFEETMNKMTYFFLEQNIGDSTIEKTYKNNLKLLSKIKSNFRNIERKMNKS